MGTGLAEFKDNSDEMGLRLTAVHELEPTTVKNNVSVKDPEVVALENLAKNEGGENQARMTAAFSFVSRGMESFFPDLVESARNSAATGFITSPFSLEAHREAEKKEADKKTEEFAAELRVAEVIREQQYQRWLTTPVEICGTTKTGQQWREIAKKIEEPAVQEHMTVEAKRLGSAEPRHSTHLATDVIKLAGTPGTDKKALTVAVNNCNKDIACPTLVREAANDSSLHVSSPSVGAYHTTHVSSADMQKFAGTPNLTEHHAAAVSGNNGFLGGLQQGASNFATDMKHNFSAGVQNALSIFSPQPK